MTETNRSNVLNRLIEGITQLTNSEKWQEWLTMQSRFHHYSFNNTLLILTQRRNATRVAGYNAWRQFNRFVRKGEKGIWILAPMVYKTTDEVNGSDSSETTKVIRGFKPVAVFDVSQTDGEELPQVCSLLAGEDETQLFDRLRGVATGLGFTVEDADDIAGANGDCTHTLHRIRVLSSNSGMQRVKTLAHEIGHAILHEHYDSRQVAELEAESIAFVVCAQLGVASDDYSFGYVANWAGGGDEALAAIKASGARIANTAEQILSVLGAEASAEVAA